MCERQGLQRTTRAFKPQQYSPSTPNLCKVGIYRKQHGLQRALNYLPSQTQVPVEQRMSISLRFFTSEHKNKHKEVTAD